VKNSSCISVSLVAPPRRRGGGWLFLLHLADLQAGAEEVAVVSAGGLLREGLDELGALPASPQRLADSAEYRERIPVAACQPHPDARLLQLDFLFFCHGRVPWFWGCSRTTRYGA